jgi:DNA topoisomerase-1
VRLAEIGKAEDERQARRNIVRAVKRVAERLGNTPTVCRNCYIHPKVLELYLEGVTLEEFRPKRERRIRRLQPEYEPEELALLKLLRVARIGAAANASAASNGSRRRAA